MAWLIIIAANVYTGIEFQRKSVYVMDIINDHKKTRFLKFTVRDRGQGHEAIKKTLSRFLANL